MRGTVYVDGFNLYYALKEYADNDGKRYKWLNIAELARKLLPSTTQIVGIKYFTAAISALPHDPDNWIRQQAYWRALKTIPHLEIIEGSFKRRIKRWPQVLGKSKGKSPTLGSTIPVYLTFRVGAMVVKVKEHAECRVSSG